jgi:hypothetical protein
MSEPKTQTTNSLDALTVRNEIIKFLWTIEDQGTELSSGGGLGSEDIWVTIGGKRFYIAITEQT